MKRNIDWRFPLRKGEDWDTLRYHPEEISELYLGAKMTEALRAEMISLAQAVNPTINIYQMLYDASDKLSFAQESP